MLEQEILKAKKYLLKNVLEVRPGYPWRGAINEAAVGDVFAVQPKDISATGELIFEGMVRTQLTGKRQPDWLKSNDVLIINKGLRNTAAYIDQDLKDTAHAPTLFLLRPTKDWAPLLNMKFIAWQLNQAPTQNHFKRSSEGSLQVSLRRKVVEDTPIAIPSIETQNIIAQFYDSSLKEQKILEALITNRKKQMTAIASQLLNQ